MSDNEHSSEYNSFDRKFFNYVKETDEILKDQSGDKAGYPPNCKEGYIEKDGKCVPKEGA